MAGLACMPTDPQMVSVLTDIPTLLDVMKGGRGGLGGTGVLTLNRTDAAVSLWRLALLNPEARGRRPSLFAQVASAERMR